MAKRIPPKTKKKLDKIFKGVCIYWCVFVAVAWITFWFKDSVPDTLIQYGLGGGAVELIVSGVIEITRDLRQRGNDDGKIDE